MLGTSTFLVLVVVCAAAPVSSTVLQHSQGLHNGHSATGPFPRTAALRASKPNFVVFFLDDFGWGDVGAFWNTTKETPYMDALAHGGMMMSDLHAGASVCTPSRAALLTGRLGLRTGVTHNFSPSSIAGLPTNETTFAEMLKTVGYRTGMLGKWHLGTTKGFHPYYRGFDFVLTVPYSIDMGCSDVCGQPSLGMPVNLPQQQRCGFDPGAQLKKKGDPAVPLYQQDTIIDQPTDLCELSDRYVSAAEAFIRSPGIPRQGVTSSADMQQEPFLLYVPLSQVHVPHAHAPRFTNVSTRGVFGDTLAEADATVGRIIQALREAHVYNNTLIFLTGDNGPWEVKCDLAGSAGPFTGEWQRKEGGGGSASKMTTWEGGHREVGIFSWQGQIKPGQRSSALVSTMDILPTMAHLSGAQLPANREFDGVNISPILFDGAASVRNELFHPNSGANQPSGALNTVRFGPYKAHYETGGEVTCGGKRGPVMQHNPPLLFDLSTDPAEAHALDTTQPKYKAIVQQIDAARTAILDNIAADNTTVANYAENEADRPCCNPQHVECRCNH